MENKNLQQENNLPKPQVEQMQSKLDAIEKSQQRKTKFQLWLGRVGQKCFIARCSLNKDLLFVPI